MLDTDGFPIIKTLLRSSLLAPSHHLYYQSARLILKELLPDSLLMPPERAQDNLRKKMDAILPLVKLTMQESVSEAEDHFFFHDLSISDQCV